MEPQDGSPNWKLTQLQSPRSSPRVSPITSPDSSRSPSPDPNECVDAAPKPTVINGNASINGAINGFFSGTVHTPIKKVETVEKAVKPKVVVEKEENVDEFNKFF
jgi:hypothetical protein